MLSKLLVRPWAWRLNKVPLSVTLVLLLLDGGPLSMSAAASMVLVVLSVCAVGNYGYALNDLYDIEEDTRTGRPNAALALGRGRTGWIVAGSAVAALALGWLAAGAWGAALTLGVLMLPLAYSVPPLRIKERGWMGVAADALAAHVFPAALAVLTVTHLGPAQPSTLAIGCILAWSAAAGLRGILSHQLKTADRDVQGGLRTVVHALGRPTVERFVLFVLLPVEAAGFIGAVVASDTGPVLWAFGTLYLACEIYRTANPRFRVRALRPEGQRYLPLVEECFYKAWGPFVIAFDAARIDLKFLVVPLLYALMFRMHLKNEAGKLKAIGESLAAAPKAG